jgi:hypothetical protein
VAIVFRSHGFVHDFKTVALTDSAPCVTVAAEQIKTRAKKMSQQSFFHAPHCGADFLGLRTDRSGATEIVYDDGVKRRLVWRVSGRAPSTIVLADALRAAVGALRVVPTLYDELKKRSIAIEAVVR